MSRVAECCCGKSKLEVEGNPERHAVCSCNNCKKRTGSAFGIPSYFRKDQVITMPSTGLSLYELHNAEQNHDQKQYFYSSCGTTLFWYVSSLKEMIGIAGGCFVDSPLPLPPISLNHSQKCDWLLFDESCKAVK